MYRKKRKKQIGRQMIVGLLLLFLTGCNRQADFYVNQQESEQLIGDSTHSVELVSDTKGADSTELPADAERTGNPSASENQDTLEEKALADSESLEGEELVYVQVSGAVVKPGVYQLPKNSRIFEAIKLAGGVTEEADEASVNQAQPVSDGQMIYMYAVGERKQTAPEAAEQEDKRVNLNTATAEQLMTLPGIGQAKAESIISFREAHGGFQNVEDIMNIEGIKEGVFLKIKDQIKVN